MPLRYMPQPMCRVQLNDYTYTDTAAFNVRVTRRENGVDMATVDFVDKDALKWTQEFDVGDSAVIGVKDQSESSYTTIFRGRVAPAIEPYLPSDSLHIKCEGNGWPLTCMMVAEEYGSQVSASLDEVDEIVDDIVDNYVEKIYADAASGHTVTTEIDDTVMTNTMRYMSFPYVPAYKAINQLLEIYQGTRGTSVGGHWVVDTESTPTLYIQHIGAHSGTAVADGWSSYYGGEEDSNASKAIFIQGADFTTCRFQKMTKLANYVLYYGAWKHPCPIDLWTENNSGDWEGKELVSGNPLTINDSATCTYGAKSIEMVSEAGVGAGEGAWAWYPDSYDLGLDLTKVGGDYAAASIDVYLRPSNNGVNDVDLDGTTWWFPEVMLGTGDPANFDVYIHPVMPELKMQAWATVSIPVGSKYGWYTGGGGGEDWTDIDWVGFRFYNKLGTPTLMIDGLHFSGHVARVVSQSAGYDSDDPCIMRVVTDDYAKDDVIVDGDKTGTISKLAYAEYLRCISEPTTGTFTTPLVKDLWPGQIVAVKAKKTLDGTYRINDDFRVPSFDHVIGASGFFTSWQVTDDVTNTHTRPAYNSINANLAAVRPGTQDMQATSMKMREIDITQPRLVNTY